MAEEDKAKENTEGSEEHAAEGHGAAGGKSKKKKMLMIAIPVILALAGGGGFFVMKKKSAPAEDAVASGDHPPLKSEKKSAEGEAKKEGHGGGKEEGKNAAKAPNLTTTSTGEVYMDLNEFIVNLNRGDKQTSFLKLKVTLQIPDSDTASKIQDKMPIITDAFQTYLRELRAEDLQGSAGIYQLREELSLRINRVLYPDKVIDILFSEIIVQ